MDSGKSLALYLCGSPGPALEHSVFLTVLLLAFLKSFVFSPVSSVDRRLDLNSVNKCEGIREGTWMSGMESERQTGRIFLPPAASQLPPSGVL